MHLRLTPAARADLAEIRDFTRARWGQDQWSRYLDRLNLCLERIADDPGLGLSREPILPGLRSLTCQRHLIFFTVAGGEVVVLRLSHAARDHAALRFADDLDAP